MSIEHKDPKAVKISIMGTDYSIACAESEVLALKQSASMLDGRMREIRNSGKVAGTDRIAVMAALNLTNELLKAKQELSKNQEFAEEHLTRLTHKVEAALNQAREIEL